MPSQLPAWMKYRIPLPSHYELSLELNVFCIFLLVLLETSPWILQVLTRSPAEKLIKKSGEILVGISRHLIDSPRFGRQILYIPESKLKQG